MSDCQSTGTGAYWAVRVLVESHLDDWIGDYLGGIQMLQRSDGTTVFFGSLPDVAGVYGLILQLRDSGIVPIEIGAKWERTGD